MRLLLAFIFLSVAHSSAKSIRGPYTETRVRMRSIESALYSFESVNGSFPKSSNWWSELNGASNATINSQRENFADAVRYTNDAWGNSFAYRYPGLTNQSGFDLYSTGADGHSASNGNDPDDIPNWNKPCMGPHQFPASKQARSVVLKNIVVVLVFAIPTWGVFLRKPRTSPLS